jgi:hypothetical protein
MEIGSQQCDLDYYDSFSPEKTKKLADEMSYTGRAMRYKDTDWLSKQNFCYEDQESVELFSTLTYIGICFGFNMNENIYDQAA